MTREAIMQRTLEAISKLPQDKATEIVDFAEFILKKYDDEMLREGIKKFVADSNAFEFLRTEEDLYTLDDLKEIYK